MAKKKIFISSVQSEFAMERQALHDYVLTDALLGKFFEPFLFELLPAMDQRADAIYLQEVELCDIYLGLLGKDYGFEDNAGVSPTEKEFNHATLHNKTRFVFLTNHAAIERHNKENVFIKKAQDVLVRKRFTTIDELKAALYASLIWYLEEKEIIRVGPFDASFNQQASLEDLDAEKVKLFVRIAKSKRGFPLSEESAITDILTHLNLVNENRITNAAILLFGKGPQRFFINSEVRCASFYGTIVEKPIPSYKVFKGTVFELVDQAVDFVLSKLDYRVGTRAETVQIPGHYEIPKEVMTEAIVNAIAHRDYTSNASVQVMLFKDRVEIWNPGSLPLGWTTQKLKQLHTSVPANPLLAEPMYLAGYIERLGTGTSDIVQKSLAMGLKEPEFIQAEDFKTILYRPNAGEVPGKYLGSTEPATEQVTEQAAVVLPQKYRSTSVEVRNLVKTMKGEMNRKEIQTKLMLKHEGNFRDNYLNPALNKGFIEMTDPANPTSPNQKYKLTAKGFALADWYATRQMTPQVTPQVTMQDSMQDSMQVTMQVEQLVVGLTGELTRDQLQYQLKIKNRDYFRKAYINEALNKELIEMTLPEKPNSKNQKYRLTAKGIALQKQLKKKK